MKKKERKIKKQESKRMAFQGNKIRQIFIKKRKKKRKRNRARKCKENKVHELREALKYI